MPIFWKFKDNVKNLSTHNLLCRKFADVFRKVQLLAPVSTSLHIDARASV